MIDHRTHIVVLLLTLLLLPFGVLAADYRLSSGQAVYVPVYASVFSAPKGINLPLATILSIRNTDTRHAISVTAADYYDTKGKFLSGYIGSPQTLAPLESTAIYLPAGRPDGGVGANFVVRWKATREVNAPIIECVMLSTRSGQGISFVSPGQVIREGGE